MRNTVLLLLLAGSAPAGGILSTAAWKSEPAAPALLEAFKLANENKDAGRVAALLARVRVEDMSAAERDGLAQELGRSLAAFRKNLEIEREVVNTLGELRSKRALAPLKRFAFRRKPRSDRDVSLQVAALHALGKQRDPKLLGAFEKVLSNHNIDVAKAAYTGLGHYADAKARVRKRVAEILIKRLLLEYPGDGSGAWVSNEQWARWRSISSAIVSSLQSVSHEATINDPEDWRRWWKETKRKPWRDHPKG